MSLPAEGNLGSLPPPPPLPPNDFLGGPISNLPGAPGYTPEAPPAPVNLIPPAPAPSTPDPLQVMLQEMLSAGLTFAQIQAYLQSSGALPSAAAPAPPEEDVTDLLGFAEQERKKIEQDEKESALEQAAYQQAQQNIDLGQGGLLNRPSLEREIEANAEVLARAKNVESNERYDRFLTTLRGQVESFTPEEQLLVFQNAGLDTAGIAELRALLENKISAQRLTPPVRKWLDENAERFRREIVIGRLGDIIDEGLEVVPNIEGGEGQTLVLPRLSPTDFRDDTTRELYAQAVATLRGDTKQFATRTQYGLTFINNPDIKNIIYDDGAFYTMPALETMTKLIARYEGVSSDGTELALHKVSSEYLEEHLLDFPSLASIDRSMLPSLLLRPMKDFVTQPAFKAGIGPLSVTLVGAEDAILKELEGKGLTEQQAKDLVTLFLDAESAKSRAERGDPNKRLKRIISIGADHAAAIPIGAIPLTAPAGLVGLVPMAIPVPSFTVSDLGFETLGDVGATAAEIAKPLGAALDKLSYPADKYNEFLASMSIMQHSDDRRKAWLARGALAGILGTETAVAIATTIRSGGVGAGFWPAVTTTGAALFTGASYYEALKSYELDRQFLDEANKLSAADQRRLGDVFASALLMPGRAELIGERLRKERERVSVEGGEIDLDSIIREERTLADEFWLVAIDPLNVANPELVLGNGVRRTILGLQTAKKVLPLTDKARYVAIGATRAEQGPQSIIEGIVQFVPHFVGEDADLLNRSSAMARYDLAHNTTHGMVNMSLRRVVEASTSTPGGIDSATAQKTLWNTFKEFVRGGADPNLDSMATAMSRYNQGEPLLVDRQLEDVGGEIFNSKTVELEFPSMNKKIAPGRTREEQLTNFENLPPKERAKYYSTVGEFFSDFTSDFIQASNKRILRRYGLDPDNLPLGVTTLRRIKAAAGVFLNSPRYVARNWISAEVPSLFDDHGFMIIGVGNSTGYLNDRMGEAASVMRFAGATPAEQMEYRALAKNDGFVRGLTQLITGGDGFRSLLFGDRKKLSGVFSAFTRMGSRFEAEMGQVLTARGMEEYIKQAEKLGIYSIPDFVDPATQVALMEKIKAAKNGAHLKELVTMELTGDGVWRLNRNWSIHDLFDSDYLRNNTTIQEFLKNHPEWEAQASQRLEDAIESFKAGKLTQGEVMTEVRGALVEFHSQLMTDLTQALTEIGIPPEQFSDKTLDYIIGSADAAFKKGKASSAHMALSQSARWKLSRISTNQYVTNKMDELAEAAIRLGAPDLFISAHERRIAIVEEFGNRWKKVAEQQDALGLTQHLTEHEDARTAANVVLSRRVIEAMRQTTDPAQLRELTREANKLFAKAMDEAETLADERAIGGPTRKTSKKGKKGTQAIAYRKRKPVRPTPGSPRWVPEAKYPQHIAFQLERNTIALDERRANLESIQQLQSDLSAHAETIFQGFKPVEDHVANLKKVSQGSPRSLGSVKDLQAGDRVVVTAGTVYPKTGDQILDNMGVGDRVIFTRKRKFTPAVATERQRPVSGRVVQPTGDPAVTLEAAKTKLGWGDLQKPAPADLGTRLADLTEEELLVLRNALKSGIGYGRTSMGVQKVQLPQIETALRMRSRAARTAPETAVRYASQASEEEYVIEGTVAGFRGDLKGNVVPMINLGVEGPPLTDVEDVLQVVQDFTQPAPDILSPGSNFRNLSRGSDVPNGRYEVIGLDAEGVTVRNITTNETITRRLTELRKAKSQHYRAELVGLLRGDVDFLMTLRRNGMTPEEYAAIRELEQLGELGRAIGMTPEQKTALASLRKKLGLKTASRERILKAALNSLEETKQYDKQMKKLSAAINSQIKTASKPLKNVVSRQEFARLLGGTAPEDVVTSLHQKFWSALAHRKTMHDILDNAPKQLQALLQPGPTYTPDQARALQEMIDSAATQKSKLIDSALIHGTLVRDNVLHNYSNTYNWDYLAKWIFPWELWMTRSAAKYAVRMVDHAPVFSKMDMYWDKMDAIKEGLPDFYKDKMPLPLPFAGLLPEWLQGDFFTTAYSAFLPTDVLTDYTPIGEDKSTIGKMYHTMDNFGVGVNPYIGYALRASGALGSRAKEDVFGPALPMEPVINTITMLTSKVIPGFPIDWRFSPSDARATQRILVEMEERGDISHEQALAAITELNAVMAGKKGHVYIPTWGAVGGIRTDNAVLKLAIQRAQTKRMLTSELSYWTALSLYNYSESEQRIDAVLAERNKIDLIENDEERSSSLDKFYDDHPYLRTKFIGGLTNDKRYQEALLATMFNNIETVHEAADTQISDLAKSNPLDPRIDAVNAGRFQQIDEIRLKFHEVSGTNKLPGTLSPFRLLETTEAGNIGILKPFAEWAKLVHDRITADEFYTHADDQGNTYFDVDGWMKTSASFKAILPPSILKEFEFEDRKNDSAVDAVRKVIKDIYSLAQGEASKAGAGLAGAERAEKQREFEESWKPPSAQTIISEVTNRYGDQFTKEELRELTVAALPTIDASFQVNSQAAIERLKETGVGFVARSGEPVTKTNIADYERARQSREEMFTQLSFGNTGGFNMWDENVELFFGSGRAGAELVRSERALDVQISLLFDRRKPDEANALIAMREQVRTARKLLGVPDEATATFPGIQENLNLIERLKGDITELTSSFEEGRVSKEEYVRQVAQWTKDGLVVVNGKLTDGEAAKKALEERKQAYDATDPARTTRKKLSPEEGLKALREAADASGLSDEEFRAKLADVKGAVTNFSVDEIMAQPDFEDFKNDILERSFQPGDDVPEDRTFAFLKHLSAGNHNEIQRLFQDIYKLTQLDSESLLAKEIRRLPHVKSALFGISQLRVRTVSLIMAIDDMLKLFNGEQQFDLDIPTANEFASTIAPKLGIKTTSSGSADGEAERQNARGSVSGSGTGSDMFRPTISYGVTSWEDVKRVAFTLFGNTKLLDGLEQMWRSGTQLGQTEMRQARFMYSVVPVDGATTLNKWFLGLELIFQTDSVGASSPTSQSGSSRSRFPQAIRERRF